MDQARKDGFHILNLPDILTNKS